MAPQKKQKQANNRSVITVAIIIVLGAGIVALAFVFPSVVNLSGNNSVTVKVPLIVTPLTSAHTGEVYSVQSLFAVKMDTKTRDKVSKDVLFDALTEIMSEMDFDAIAAQNGVEYINQYATEALNEYLKDYTDTQVAVTDLLVSDRIKLSTETPNQQNDVMKGLFQKME